MRPALAVLAALLLPLCAAPTVHAARGWSPAVALDPALGARDATTAVATPGGTALTWRAPDGQVTVARVPGRGATALGPGDTPSLAVSADGSMLVTWVDAGNRGRAATVPVAGAPVVEDLGPVDPLFGVLGAVDRAGDQVVAYSDGTHNVTRYRPVGGALEAPVTLGSGYPTGLGLGKGGLTVALIGDTVWRQSAGGVPVADPESPAVSSERERTLMVDGAGRVAIAGGELTGSRLRVAIGTADGRWSDTGLVGAPDGAPVLRGNDAGQLVIAWTDDSLSPWRTLRVVTGDLATGTFAPASIDGAPASFASLKTQAAINPDGSALVIWGAFPEIHTARRDGLGPFDGAQVLECPQHRDPLAVGLDDDGTGRVVVDRDDARTGLRVLTDDPAVAPVPERCPYVPTAVVQHPEQQPGGGPVSVGGLVPGMRVAGRQRLRTVLRKGLRLAVDVPQAGSPRFALVVPKRQARKVRIGRKATTIGQRTVALHAGRNDVAVKVAKRLRRRLAKARRLTVQVRVTTAAGGLVLKTQATLRR